MGDPQPAPSAAISALLLLLGIALLGLGQVLSLQAGAIESPVTLDPATTPSLLGWVAEHLVTPVMRLVAAADPPPERVLARVRHLAFAGLFVGLALAVLGARRIQLSRHAERRRARR